MHEIKGAGDGDDEMIDDVSITFDYKYTPKVRLWEKSKAIMALTQRLSQGHKQYEELINTINSLSPFFEKISLDAPNDLSEPYWQNDWLPPLDGMSLYALIASRNPRLYVEIGSGNSTKFVRRAIADHDLRTKIISIDPSPRAEIDTICDRIIRQPCETVNISFFEELTSADMLFVDNSHRSFQNSDVTVFFMEILPALPKRMIVGVHDIFLPEDYPEDWKARFYNEQYLLAAYIFGGMDGGHIIFPSWYISKTSVLRERLLLCQNLNNLPVQGGTFWWSR